MNDEKEIKLQMSEGLWKRAKVAAAQTGISLKVLCTEAITKEVVRLEAYHKKD